MDRWVDKEDKEDICIFIHSSNDRHLSTHTGMCVHNRILLSQKKNDILLFLTTEYYAEWNKSEKDNTWSHLHEESINQMNKHDKTEADS